MRNDGGMGDVIVEMLALHHRYCRRRKHNMIVLVSDRPCMHGGFVQLGLPCEVAVYQCECLQILNN